MCYCLVSEIFGWIIFISMNDGNKYYSTRRQIGHITVNETHDNRPMRYNKRDLYPDVFYGICYHSGAVQELVLIQGYFRCEVDIYLY